MCRYRPLFQCRPSDDSCISRFAFLSSIEIVFHSDKLCFLAGWMGNESLEVVIKKSEFKILFFYLVSILLNSFGDQVLTATFGFGHALVQGLLGLF